MKKLFWVLLHSVTALIIISGLISFFGVPQLTQKSFASPSTLVAGATTFSIPSDSADPNKVFDLVNKLRTDNGLQILVGDPILTKLAEERAKDMVARSYYAHKNPDGKDFYSLLQVSGSAPSYACENLSLEPSKDIQASYESWLMSTQGHKECMLNIDITRAGYASKKLYDIPTNNGMTPYYLVVAIHATQN